MDIVPNQHSMQWT